MSTAQVPSPARLRVATARRLERATGRLAGAVIARMDSLEWYRAMPAEERSWVGLVAQAGIAAFVEWFRRPQPAPSITADVFGTAPRELIRAVTLRQTVELVRVTIEVVEERVDELAAPGGATMLREGVLTYSREIAFAAAQVYAGAAEARGAWDARLEALVVDTVLRGEADDGLRSRAAALGWGAPDTVVAVAGRAPDADPETVLDGIRAAARRAGIDVLSGVQGERLLAIAGLRGGVTDGSDVRLRALVPQFGPGPVVVGPPVGDLMAATRSARAAIRGLRAAAAWPGAPRPVLAADLLPERALAGDQDARRALIDEVYAPLAASGSALLETLSAYLEQSGSLEAAARALFVHPNTVRYRLRRVADVTGYAATEARAAFTLRVALTLGRLADAAAPSGADAAATTQKATTETRRNGASGAVGL
jgi:PucR-like helix-turn-helix protein/diguanylate cyclase with GGDEF domain